MKTCPYCGEKIQDLAKKCRFCGEFLNEDNEAQDVDSVEVVEGEIVKDIPGNHSHRLNKKIVIIMLIVIAVFFIFWYAFNNKKHDIWQGFYFPDGLLDGTEIGGPIFDNYEACKDWALSKYNNGYEAWCSKNCHDSKGGMGICEDVIRTWHPLPGFGTVFEGIPEDRPEPEKACEKPKNNFNLGAEFDKGYDYAKNGGNNCGSGNEDFMQGCTFYFFDVWSYLSCKNECENLEEYSDERFECIYKGNSRKEFLEDNQVPSLNEGEQENDSYIDTSSWKTYDDLKLTFKYPSYMYTSNRKFSDFTFFSDPTNIYVTSYTFDALFDPIIKTIRDIEEEFCDYDDQVNGKCHSTTYDKFYNNHKKRYEQIIQDIKDGKTITRDSFFDQYSNWGTKGPIIFKNVTVNGNRGLIVYYYFTQDAPMGCFTQITTELLILKDDKIYSLMFKNNFGGVYELMKPYDDGYGEACLFDTYNSRTEAVDNQILDYYENGTSLKGTNYEVFEENDKIIKAIINTVTIK